MRLIDFARSRVADDQATLDFAPGRGKTRLGLAPVALADASALVVTSCQMAAALALVELDGLVRRLVVAPDGLTDDDIAAIIADAEIDVVVSDRARAQPQGVNVQRVDIDLTDTVSADRPAGARETEWVLLTSGTSGRPKLVAHTLGGLTGAIAGTATPSANVWATFYDIRRYGGLQIFLRAVVGGSDLILSCPHESLDDFLRRLTRAGVTHISGTPSHWRKLLMSKPQAGFAPGYVRLSGETADQPVLDGLRERFPQAAIEHAYASTEAGVAFAVNDGRAGFPRALLDAPGAGVEMKLLDGTLRIRSARTASRYIGTDAPALMDGDGFVDTGDLIEQRGDRLHFLGRRNGAINVGGQKVAPEEVEAVLNASPLVAQSRVFARRNPITGAIVAAEIVPRDPGFATEAGRRELADLCRARLPAHKTPAVIRFVDAIALTSAGKVRRAPLE